MSSDGLLCCWHLFGFVVSASHASSDTDESEKYTFFWQAESPFSQWYGCIFTVDDIEYNCAEQYMMHQKACEWPSLYFYCLVLPEFLAHDAFVRTNRHAIATMFVRLSVCLGRVCIVIIRCMLAWI